MFSSTNVTASPHPQATPAVHILMPVYNALDYIYEAIESVFSQSYQNLKLIIFDDGSTDKLLPLVQKFKKNHPQIGGRLWLTRVDKNRGTAYARTRLIQLSKCLNSFAYIGWLDADDKFADNDFVCKVIQQMLTTKAAICLFNFAVTYEDESQKKNATGLLIEKKQSTDVLAAILATTGQASLGVNIPNLLNFTSLGWTKFYAPNVEFPTPDNCPFEDFVYMAMLLENHLITALDPSYEPISYLRRSTSVCGKRTVNNFLNDVPRQLQLFFDRVIEQINPEVDSVKKIALAQDFVARKISQYHFLLSTVSCLKSDEKLLLNLIKTYVLRANNLQGYIDKFSAGVSVDHIQANIRNFR